MFVEEEREREREKEIAEIKLVPICGGCLCVAL